MCSSSIIPCVYYDQCLLRLNRQKQRMIPLCMLYSVNKMPAYPFTFTITCANRLSCSAAYLHQSEQTFHPHSANVKSTLDKEYITSGGQSSAAFVSRAAAPLTQQQMLSAQIHTDGSDNTSSLRKKNTLPCSRVGFPLNDFVISLYDCRLVKTLLPSQTAAEIILLAFLS